MNSLLLGFFVLALFFIGFLFYGKRIENVFCVDESRKTPAFTNYDGVDYVPARHWLVLFGHHFAAIAGAAPIIGPVIAISLWGWGPAILWVVLGSIFMGGVHDFGALFVSVRKKGLSIANVSEDLLGKRAKVLFSLFIWLTLILIVSVFVYLTAKTFIEEPKIVVSSLGLIPVAILLGFMLYNLRMNQVMATILGLSLMIFLIFLGRIYPVYLGKNSLTIWIFILLLYCFFASVIPVNILLQPRDYLCGLLLIGGVAAGYIGLLLTHPDIHTSFFTKFSTQKGNLWPFLFVTIACGAISGFHSLVASGTTSKQLSSEKDALKIGYMAMLFEGLVSSLAIICVITIFTNQKELQMFLTTSGKTPISAFAFGYQGITKPIFKNIGALVAITLLNSFILSTLDAGTRIARYITQELFVIKDRYLATLFVIAPALWLALSGKWLDIWPVFGASNQLVASFSLVVITFWLISRKKPSFYTLIPSVFVYATTFFALLQKGIQFVRGSNYLLAIICACLVVLALVFLYEAAISLRKIKS